jgi:selenobiotic family peptide radical SAM maturase
VEPDANPQKFPDILAEVLPDLQLPAFIVDLARIEWAWHSVHKDDVDIALKVEAIAVNPTLVILPVAWQNLVALVMEPSDDHAPVKASNGTHVIVWRHPQTAALNIREAVDEDLLALKITVENVPVAEAAAIGGTTRGVIESIIYRAVAQGLLIAPDSRIRRREMPKTDSPHALDAYLSADIFTLQWHITQACDLHCKHCYDRSARVSMPFHSAVGILDDFYRFCRIMHVRGQVTFTGGNPLLYPDFIDIYRKTSERGFGIAILGNPTAVEKIETLVAIEKPLYFQISLEGLEDHNDTIRGQGHFKRSLAFLEALRHLGIYTMVMLTLTRDNIDQVLPLAEMLNGRADFFTFNRLSTVGEGADLAMADPHAFASFLKDYEAACQENPILGLKDNLLNIVREETGQKLFGGCTGFGCGAAFNFVALLPDGEVHACRKFPSPIGSLLQNRLVDIYQSDLAKKYRAGSQACRECELNAVCRGCLAITHSYGLDVFKDKDPFCFRVSTTC